MVEAQLLVLNHTLHNTSSSYNAIRTIFVQPKQFCNLLSKKVCPGLLKFHHLKVETNAGEPCSGVEQYHEHNSKITPTVL